MRITVFGATGGIGGHVVRQALDAGHRVTAVVRDPARFDLRHPALAVVTVPGLAAPEALRPALEGTDAAISGVGPRGRKDGPVASTVSAVPVGPVPEGESFANRRLLLPFIKALLRDVYADLAEMESQMRQSTLDWTIVRPPKLVSKPLTGVYRMCIGANVPRAYAISRANVAHAMLAVLNDPATVRQAVGVAN
jgi:uncharacterized protein YbjT (DUF2867 family)